MENYSCFKTGYTYIILVSKYNELLEFCLIAIALTTGDIFLSPFLLSPNVQEKEWLHFKEHSDNYKMLAKCVVS